MASERERRLYGEIATIHRVLGKVELAVRRASEKISDDRNGSMALEIVASELAKMQKELYNG